jgi:hypothetical protein
MRLSGRATTFDFAMILMRFTQLKYSSKIDNLFQYSGEGTNAQMTLTLQKILTKKIQNNQTKPNLNGGHKK